MSLDPVAHHRQLDTPAVVAMELDLFKHAVEALEREQPPRVDRAEELDHTREMHGKVVVYSRFNTELQWRDSSVRISLAPS